LTIWRASAFDAPKLKVVRDTEGLRHAKYGKGHLHASDGWNPTAYPGRVLYLSSWKTSSERTEPQER
jgi:hypothetical protein